MLNATSYVTLKPDVLGLLITGRSYLNSKSRCVYTYGNNLKIKVLYTLSIMKFNS